MRNRRKRNRQRHRRRPQFYRRSSLLLLLTALYMLIYITPVFIGHYKAAEVASGELMSQGIIDLVIAFVQIFCLFFALTVFRIVWILLWPLLTLFTIANDYAYSTFHAQVSKYAIAVILEPKAREAESLYTPAVFITVIGGLFFMVLGLYMLSREKKDIRNRQVALVALLFAVGLVVVNQGGASTPYPPYNFLTAAYQYSYEHLGLASSERRDIADVPAQYTPVGDKPLVVVVVIGESARGDHFSINGYERETTPLLQKRKNLINFKDTISCGVWTRVAVPCLMTRATIADQSLMYAETSFISVFKKLGFQTYWLSTQGKTAVHYPVTPIAYEAEEHIMLEEQQVLDNTIKDEQLIPLVEERLKDQTKPVLIVLHTYGSHWQYSARHTKEFERFTPGCETTLARKYDANEQLTEVKDCYTNQEALVNSYDNSILYTDYVLDKLISTLENKNALFLYTSDHGESLGENGRFMHGHADRADNRIVPMFWWASDSYIAANQTRWNALLHKAPTPTSHDIIFHSVLDCSGISSELIDPAISLCHFDTATTEESPSPLEAIPPSESKSPDKETHSPDEEDAADEEETDE